jgi:hypothetical protein
VPASLIGTPKAKNERGDDQLAPGHPKQAADKADRKAEQEPDDRSSRLADERSRFGRQERLDDEREADGDEEDAQRLGSYGRDARGVTRPSRPATCR